MPIESMTTTSHVHKSHPSWSAAVAVRGKIEPTGVGDDLELNPKYFVTLPGIIKLIEIVIGIVCMVCISPNLTWFARLFTCVVVISFALTVILCFCYLVTLKNVVFPQLDWIKGELIFASGASLLYLITSIIQLTVTSRIEYRITLQYYGYFGSYIVAGVFGLLNFIVYGVDAYFLYLNWKESRENRNVNIHHSNGHP